MRTKKIISLILSVIVMAGVFGVTGVFAAGNSGPLTSNADVRLEERPSEAGSWDGAVLLWEGWSMTPNQSGTSVVDNSYAYCAKPANGSTASVSWAVNLLDYNNGAGKNVDPYASRDKAVLANPPFVAYRTTSSTYTEERLVLAQGTAKYTGSVSVTITVTVPSSTVTTAAGGVTTTTTIPAGTYTKTVTVHLVDSKAFNDAYNAAKALATDKRNHYTDSYLKKLDGVINAADLARASKPTDAEIASITDSLKTVIELGKQEDNFKLFGWDQLDQAIKFKKSIWTIIDWFAQIKVVFDKIGTTIGPVTDFFTKIGNGFGFLLPLFSLLSKLVI